MRERGNGALLEESNESDDDCLMDESKLGPPFGIVINGHSLVRKLIVSYIPACMYNCELYTDTWFERRYETSTIRDG